MANETSNDRLLALISEITSAYVSNNPVPMQELPQLISDVHKSLSLLGAEAAQPERPQPAVPIKKSITPEYIICLEDGKKLKMLRRHLQTAYGMTPEDYRGRWGLPIDYPMVAPDYARHRSRLAKKSGLGTRTRRVPRT